ncbi:hypothetical protein [Streptomyces sp. NPDC054863]
MGRARTPQAARLAGRAANYQGQDALTDAAGEGLAAIAYAVLEAAGASRPQVWLEVSSRPPAQSVLVRKDDIVGVRVRAKDSQDGGEEPFRLEVFVHRLEQLGWLQVADGASEWFELGAAEELLRQLQDIASTEDGSEYPTVFVNVRGENDGSLDMDRSY